MEADIYDPWADAEEVKHEYGLDILTELPGHPVTQSLSHSVTPSLSHSVTPSLLHSVTQSLSHSSPVTSYAAIILAVAHNEFKNIDIAAHKAGGTIIYDVKGILPKEIVDARL